MLVWPSPKLGPSYFVRFSPIQKYFIKTEMSLANSCYDNLYHHERIKLKLIDNFLHYPIYSEFRSKQDFAIHIILIKFLLQVTAKKILPIFPR